MKRHPGLVPLSHDHHHVLVEARRLRRAADGAAEARTEAGRRFLALFARETAVHFREEEELLFPLLVAHAANGEESLAAALVEHARVRALVRTLERELDGGSPAPETLRQLGELVVEHVRREERELFALVQDEVPADELEGLGLASRREDPQAAGDPVVRLAAGEGPGPVWGTASEDLNATLLAWSAGGGTPEQVNEERDVLLLVVCGSGTLELDGEAHVLGTAHAVVVPKGTRFRVSAGAAGLRYVSVHLRRPALQISRG